MKKALINSLIFIVAIFVGANVNMALINIGPKLIAMPIGFDLTTEKGLIAAMPFMEAKHFLFPFLAHAFGTFIAALLIFVLMKEKSKYYSFFAAALFFLGGAYMVSVLPAPIWFNVTDLVLAYFPMVFLAQWLVEKRRGMKLN
jgi:hypothetical protein